MTGTARALCALLAVVGLVHSAAAQTSVGQRAKALRAAMASQPHVPAPHHTAADLTAKYRSTTAGQTALAAAHKIATSALPAAGRSSGGTGSSATQSTQPGGTSASTSGTSSGASAPLDLTIDPTQSFSAVATSAGASVQAGLWINLGAGGQFNPGTKSWYLANVDTLPGSASVWAISLTPGWYAVAFDVFYAMNDGHPMQGSIATDSPQGTRITQDCTAALAYSDSHGIATCMALFQVTQAGPQQFDFTLRTSLAQLVDVAISRVNP